MHLSHIPERIPDRLRRGGEAGQAVVAVVVGVALLLALGLLILLAAAAAAVSSCDYEADDHDPTASDPCGGAPIVDWYPDADGDAFGADDAAPIRDCLRPQGYTCDHTDCEDADPSINPGAEEICGSGVDENCDGQVDGVAEATTVYRDADGDGFGDPDTISQIDALCGVVPAGYVEDDRDCDDADAARNPGAGERRDGIDDDCDGVPDDGAFDAAWLGVGGALGAGLAAAGDVDGDGLVDLLLAADRAGGFGAIYLVRGARVAPGGARSVAFAATATFNGVDSASLTGEEVSGLGDLDGDGAADFGIGAPTGCITDCGGRLYVFYGSLGGSRWVGAGSVAEADLIIVGEGLSQLGAAFTSADLDGDGHLDLLVGAPAATQGEGPIGAGAVYVFYGGDRRLVGERPIAEADAILTGPTAAAAFGYALADAGDVDGDGLRDVIVGAPGGSASGIVTGAAYLLYGGQRLTGVVSAAAAADAIEGPGEGSLLGAAVTGADLDGDGYSDLLLGAPGACFPAGCSGAVYIGYGGPDRADGDLPAASWAAATLSSARPLSFVGAALVVADLDEDGLPDVSVGAPGWGLGSASPGAAFTLRGGTSRFAGAIPLTAAEASFIGQIPEGQTGSSLAAAPLALGAPPSLLVGAPGNLDGYGMIVAVTAR